METVFIYALNCPFTGVPRYVGKTKNPQRRLYHHLRAKERCYRTHWIQALLDQGAKPQLEILDEVPEDMWAQWEVAYIQFFREQGHALVNSNAGGEGGHCPTVETREKIGSANRGKPSPFRGIPRSAATRKKISDAVTGKPAWNKGVPHSAETREKIRFKNMGRLASEETKQKMRLKMLGDQRNAGRVASAETRQKISASLLGNKRAAGKEKLCH